MVASNPTETRMHRRLLAAFLDADPVAIELQRPNLVHTAGGGLVKGESVTLPAQQFRLVPFKKRLTQQTRDTPDGNIINLPYVLLGEHDADVQPGDYFEYENQMYDVISIEPNTAYRVAANVTYRGDSDKVWG